MNHEAAFSLDAALRRFEGNRQLLVQLAEMFRQEWPNTLAGLQAAVAAQDGPSLARQAHQLAGTLGLFAPGATMQLARQLEALAKASAWDAVPATLGQLEATMLELLEAMRQAGASE